MITVVQIPYIKFQLKFYKLHGLNPYEWNEKNQNFTVSTNPKRQISYRVSIIVHAIYCMTMMLRLYTKSFDFFFEVTGMAFLIAFTGCFFMRLNWEVKDRYLDCMNCMMRFEKVLLRKRSQGLSPRVLKCIDNCFKQTNGIHVYIMNRLIAINEFFCMLLQPQN
jgi:hypothetical protein